MGFCVCRLGHCQCWNDQNADFVVETLSESFMSSLVTMVGFGGRTGPPCRRRPDSKEPAKIPAEPPGATVISTFREVTPWQFAQLWKVPSLSPSLVTMKPQCPNTVPPRSTWNDPCDDSRTTMTNAPLSWLRRQHLLADRAKVYFGADHPPSAKGCNDPMSQLWPYKVIYLVTNKSLLHHQHQWLVNCWVLNSSKTMFFGHAGECCFSQQFHGHSMTVWRCVFNSKTRPLFGRHPGEKIASGMVGMPSRRRIPPWSTGCGNSSRRAAKWNSLVRSWYVNRGLKKLHTFKMYSRTFLTCSYAIPENSKIRTSNFEFLK